MVKGTGIMQHQATQPTGLVKYVAQTNLAHERKLGAEKTLAPKHEAPLLKRFVGKLVVDVLPATFVSVLGGFIITQYQLNHAAASHPATEQVVPASAEMMQLVRDEHAVIIDYLKTQMAAEKNRHAAEDAAVADARLAATEPPAPAAAPLPAPRAVATAVIAKPVPARTKVATAPALPPHAPLLIAQADQPVSAAPAADARARIEVASDQDDRDQGPRGRRHAARGVRDRQHPVVDRLDGRSHRRLRYDLELRRADVLDLAVTPCAPAAPALQIDRRPHEIALADFDAAMAQDVVGRGAVEIKIRQRISQ